jgi:hypothetical protein
VAEGLDPSTVRHLRRVLTAALGQAVEGDLVPDAPTAKAPSDPPLPSRRRSRPRRRFRG